MLHSVQRNNRPHSGGEAAQRGTRPTGNPPRRSTCLLTGVYPVPIPSIRKIRTIQGFSAGFAGKFLKFLRLTPIPVPQPPSLCQQGERDTPLPQRGRGAGGEGNQNSTDGQSSPCALVKPGWPSNSCSFSICVQRCLLLMRCSRSKAWASIKSPPLSRRMNRHRQWSTRSVRKPATG
jgi:hypothetical protein